MQSELCLRLKDKVEPWKLLAHQFQELARCTMSEPFPAADSIKVLHEEVHQLSTDMKAKVDMARDRFHATCVADILYHPHQNTDIKEELLQVRDFIQRGGGNTENLPKAFGKRFVAI